MLHRNRRWSVVLVTLLLKDSCSGYITPASDLSHEEIAGIWRLTSRKSFLPRLPLKEFTVVGKSPVTAARNPVIMEEEDILLSISEDGSFRIASDSDNGVNRKVRRRQGELSNIIDTAELKGIWEYLDGKLILAADRQTHQHTGEQQQQRHDTILVGNVFANKEKSLSLQAPSSSWNNTATVPSTEPDNDGGVDVHLSVPNGSVEIGRFTYPKHHPSFFEQPIFKPTPTGVSFQLRQVLGTLNAKLRTREEGHSEELFHKHCFHNKTFWLTSQPIKRHRKKSQMRWSRLLGKYVEDAPPPDPNETLDVRVMQIAFFANNTFSTIPPEGGVKILRGRFNVIGDKRDHLWFQVQRFGFGRSVSGSVYSEGIGLTADDERAYWGKIKQITIENTDNDQKDTLSTSSKDNTDTDNNNDESNKKQQLQVKGTVLLGWGLEPQPVGKFTMKEIVHDSNEEDEDDIDDEPGDETTNDTNDWNSDFDDGEGVFQ
eukprot:CAMPEP_0172483546 /NCGR_PEP_ID=MMETSP1066-20121228/10537_1 /TAXON_ID=671091 /ORGANISM="Coscinodiscus wailesii, Strain CCMP2513" /LENGTH=485 /DNA_ID=CAMNT_0013247457 /DNA_START=197 /DNA_END=1654 /DNA_ORIENTATION=+